jgi:hypothetical protein
MTSTIENSLSYPIDMKRLIEENRNHPYFKYCFLNCSGMEKTLKIPDTEYVWSKKHKKNQYMICYKKRTPKVGSRLFVTISWADSDPDLWKMVLKSEKSNSLEENWPVFTTGLEWPQAIDEAIESGRVTVRKPKKRRKLNCYRPFRNVETIRKETMIAVSQTNRDTVRAQLKEEMRIELGAELRAEIKAEIKEEIINKIEATTEAHRLAMIKSMPTPQVISAEWEWSDIKNPFSDSSYPDLTFLSSPISFLNPFP